MNRLGTGDLFYFLEEGTLAVRVDAPVYRRTLIALYKGLPLAPKVEETPGCPGFDRGDHIAHGFIEPIVIVFVEQDGLSLVPFNLFRLIHHLGDARGIINTIAMDQDKVRHRHYIGFGYIIATVTRAHRKAIAVVSPVFYAED